MLGLRSLFDCGQSVEMKICVVASEGGHLTEVLFLLPVLEKHDFFIISYDYARVRALPYRHYVLPVFPARLWETPIAFAKVFFILLRERPRVVISTGSEIAIPVFLLAKLLRIKTVYLETITRFENITYTGRILYHFSDRFFVQNPESLGSLGPKAEYYGGVF